MHKGLVLTTLADVFYPFLVHPSFLYFCFVLGLTTFLWIPPNTHTHRLKTVSLELKLDRKFLELRTLEVL